MSTTEYKMISQFFTGSWDEHDKALNVLAADGWTVVSASVSRNGQWVRDVILKRDEANAPQPVLVQTTGSAVDVLLPVLDEYAGCLRGQLCDMATMAGQTRAAKIRDEILDMFDNRASAAQPTPAPVDPQHVDEAWWDNLGHRVAHVHARFRGDVKAEKAAWDELVSHVRTYAAPALSDDAIAAHIVLACVLADTWSMEELYDAAEALSKALRKHIPADSEDAS